MNKIGKKLIRELRLLLCGWGFSIILWLVPENDPEGQIIVESIRQWASKICKLNIRKNII